MLKLTGIDITESKWKFKASYRSKYYTVEVNAICKRLPVYLLKRDEFKVTSVINKVPKDQLKRLVKDNNGNYVITDIEFPLEKAYGRTSAPIYLEREDYWNYFINKLKTILNGAN